MEEEKLIFEYLKLTMNMVKRSIKYIRNKSLTNDLRFIEWEDELNRLSTLDHSKPID